LIQNSSPIFEDAMEENKNDERKEIREKISITRSRKE
jgi:hypothetical protein